MINTIKLKFQVVYLQLQRLLFNALNNWDLPEQSKAEIKKYIDDVSDGYISVMKKWKKDEGTANEKHLVDKNRG